MGEAVINCKHLIIRSKIERKYYKRKKNKKM